MTYKLKLDEGDVLRMVNEVIDRVLNGSVDNGKFNIKSVYHVSDEDFSRFEKRNFPYYFFSSKPIRLNGNRFTYVCNLSIHKPFVFEYGESWSYPLWLYLTDSMGELIPKEQFTKERYDGYLGCPYEFWEVVYYDNHEFETDEIPEIVRRLNMAYDGVIIKGVSEGDGNDVVDDYVVFNSEQIEIVKKFSR